MTLKEMSMLSRMQRLSQQELEEKYKREYESANLSRAGGSSDSESESESTKGQYKLFYMNKSKKNSRNQQPNKIIKIKKPGGLRALKSTTELIKTSYELNKKIYRLRSQNKIKRKPTKAYFLKCENLSPDPLEERLLNKKIIRGNLKEKINKKFSSLNFCSLTKKQLELLKQISKEEIDYGLFNDSSVIDPKEEQQELGDYYDPSELASPQAVQGKRLGPLLNQQGDHHGVSSSLNNFRSRSGPFGVADGFDYSLNNKKNPLSRKFSSTSKPVKTLRGLLQRVNSIAFQHKGEADLDRQVGLSARMIRPQYERQKTAHGSQILIRGDPKNYKNHKKQRIHTFKSHDNSSQSPSPNIQKKSFLDVESKHRHNGTIRVKNSSKILTKNYKKEHFFSTQKDMIVGARNYSYRMYPKFLPGIDLSVMTFVKMIGKMNFRLMVKTEEFILHLLKTFTACSVVLTDSSIGSALKTTIKYTQSYLAENHYIDSYNTGFAVTLVLMHKKRVIRVL